MPTQGEPGWPQTRAFPARRTPRVEARLSCRSGRREEQSPWLNDAGLRLDKQDASLEGVFHPDRASRRNPSFWGLHVVIIATGDGPNRTAFKPSETVTRLTKSDLDDACNCCAGVVNPFYDGRHSNEKSPRSAALGAVRAEVIGASASPPLCRHGPCSCGQVSQLLGTS
jgi:hypothetical protein